MTRDQLESIASQMGIVKVEKSKVLTEAGKKRDIESFVFSYDTEKLIEFDEVNEAIKNGIKVKDVRGLILDFLNQASKESYKKKASGSDWLEPADYMAYRDVSSGDVVIFYRSGGRSGIDPSVYARSIGVTLTQLLEEAPLAYVEYTPKTTDTTLFRTSEILNKEVFVANSYIAPAWRKESLPEPAIHPTYDKYFRHLFPVEEERNAVFHWMYWAIKDRAQTILCVPGIQGIGKTIFGERVLRALVGRENWNKANRSFFSKEFNSCVIDRRLVLLEEVPTPKTKDDRVAINEMLKDMMNDVISVESKGSDARTISNTTSYILTSNKLRAIPLESPVDRRFLCVTTSKVKQDVAMTQEEIDFLVETLHPASPEVAALAAWILAHGQIDGRNAHYNIRNEIKYQIYRMSLSKWEIEILKYIDNNKGPKAGFFLPADLEKAVKKDRVKISTIEEFLDNFQLPSGNSIGEWDDEQTGMFKLSSEALNEPVYVNPRTIRAQIFEDEGGDEVTEAEMEIMGLRPKPITRENAL